MVRYLLLFICFGYLMSMLPAHAITSLQAQLDKNPALLGEAVTLTVTADARLSSDALNYQALQQNFRVMVPAVSQSTQVINGQTTQRTSWSFTLFPVSTGSFGIPAFEIQGVRSAPLELTVIDQSPGQRPRDIFLTATIQGGNSVYVQQMLYYEVVIHFNGDLQRGNLTEPQLEGADIMRIGNDVEGTALVDGVRYRTITRRYALIPQRSGQLQILPPLFTGEMLIRDAGRTSFFGRSQTLMAEAEPLPLEVKPQPADFPGSWLVAGLITLTEEWQPDSSTLTAGEPVTRIITLSAVDVASNQLPDIDQQLPPNIRFYHDQPQPRSAERSGRHVAQKTLTTALIATDAGEVILPEIKLPWWNSQTNQLDYAILPGRTLQVKPGILATEPPLTTAIDIPPTQVLVSPWQWNYLATLLSILWLSSVVFLWQYASRRAQRAVKPAASPIAQPRQHQPLKRACQENDAKAAKDALLAWAANRLPTPVYSLQDVAVYYDDPAFTQAINRLEQALYCADTVNWQGTTLYQSWQQLASTVKRTSQSALPGLYPE